MIVVTGATGRLGQLVIDGLLEQVPPEQVTAAVRTPEKAAPFAARGVTVRKADYNEPGQLGAAFDGAERVLLISSNDPRLSVTQHGAVIEAARQAGVAQLAYTSLWHADTSTMLTAAPTDWTGGIAFDTMQPDGIPEDAKVWESAVSKLRGRMMPPPGEKHSKTCLRRLKSA